MIKMKDLDFSYTYSFADVTFLLFLQLKFRSLRVQYRKSRSLSDNKKGGFFFYFCSLAVSQLVFCKNFWYFNLA